MRAPQKFAMVRSGLDAIRGSGMAKGRKAYRDTAVAVAAAIDVAVSQFVITHVEGWWQVIPAATGLDGLAAAPVLTQRRDRESARQQTDVDRAVRVERAHMTVTMVNGLDPLVEELGKLVAARPEARAAVCEALIVQALNTAAGLLGPPDGTRACYFETGTNEQGQLAVVPKHSTGRAGAPRSTFVQGNQAGDAVIAMLREDQTYYCHDTESDPPPGWEEHPHDYRTFVAVPARVCSSTEVESVGMLSVDALAPGDLKASDQALLRVLGSVIAVAVELTRQAKDT